jgi:hypothetical protein
MSSSSKFHEKIPKSKGVKVFGMLLILSSLLHIHKLVVDLDWYVDSYSYMPPWLIVLRYGFSWFQRMIGILVGIGLLAQKEIARKLGILIGMFTILSVYWKHPYPAFKLHAQYLDDRFGYIFSRLGFSQISFSSSSVMILAIIMNSLGDILFWCIFIYFFTRSSVKKQFKGLL